MKAQITVTMDNAAFEHERGEELARILRGIASDIDGASLNPGESIQLRDINGNTVGQFTVTN